MGLSRLVSMATTWGTSLALAHLLVPSEYGVAGMAMLVVAIFTVFQDSGLHAALIQRREGIQEAVDSAVAYTPFLGIFLLGLCVAGAPVAGHFFHRGEVTDLVRALGVVFLLRSISQVPAAVLQKELLFGRFTAVTLTGNLLQMAVVITFAARGAGAWSVIAGQIGYEAWCALLFWPLCPLRPHPRRASLRVLRELLSYGRHMVGTNVSGFVNSYVDVTVVGRLLGAAQLGAYTLGFQTGRQAVASVTYISNQVIFPAYSKLQDDLERFRRAYLRSLRFVCVISMPAGAGLAAISDVFVRVLYGARWSSAAPVLAIIAIMGAVLSVSATTGEVLKAANRPRLFFRLSLLQTSLVLVTVLSLYRFGIAAVAAALLISVSITAVACGYFVAQILGISSRDWVDAVLPSTISGALMAGGILVTKLGLGEATSTGTAPVLILLIAEGGIFYFLAMRLVAPAHFREFLDELGRIGRFSKLASRFGRLRPWRARGLIPGEKGQA